MGVGCVLRLEIIAVACSTSMPGNAQLAWEYAQLELLGPSTLRCAYTYSIGTIVEVACKAMHGLVAIPAYTPIHYLMHCPAWGPSPQASNPTIMGSWDPGQPWAALCRPRCLHIFQGGAGGVLSNLGVFGPRHGMQHGAACVITPWGC